MPLNIYIDYLSQPSRAVYIYCLTNQIPIQIKQTNISFKHHRTPQFSKINPFRKVPAIQIPQSKFNLAQSHTIIKYLHDKFKPLNDPLIPNDDKVKGYINMYLDWHLGNTRRCGNWLFYEAFSQVMGYKKPHNIKQFYEQMIQALKDIQNIFLKDNNYLLGEKYTVADLVCYCQVIQLKIVNFNFNSFPLIKQWLKRVQQQPMVQKGHQKFYSFAQSLNNAKI